nr:FUSC family protein [Streptomyces cavernae]
MTWEAAAVWRAVFRAVTERGSERDTAVQSLKAAAAALLAWALAGLWWDAPMALLAPWSAMFLVQSTVYRSLLNAVQQFVVVVVGTLLAAGSFALTHNSMAAMVLALPVTVLLGNYSRFGSQGMYAPTAALFVIAYGSYTGFDIVHRLLETLLGAVIGIGVNALVLPPVHSRHLRHLRERLPRECADLLRTVADGIEEPYDKDRTRGWYDRAWRLTEDVTEMRTARSWSDESYRFNPGRRLRRSAPEPPPDWDYTWDRLTEHIRMTLRPLVETSVEDPVREILASLLRAAGEVCGAESAAERRRALDDVRAAHRRLASVLETAGHGPTPALGGLTADAQRLLDDLVDVSEPSGTPRRTAGREP